LTFIRPEAVIFDMDGLIFDTEALYQMALLGVGRGRGLACIDADLVVETIGLSWPATRDLMADRIGDGGLADIIVAEWTSAFDVLAENQLALKPGVRELLATLDDLSIPSAIATGSYRETAMRHLGAHGLENHFQAVIAKEDCKTGKPAPEPFVLAADRLDIRPANCLALEDSANGIRSAHAAGMRAIMIPDLIEPDAEISELCAHVCASLLDVQALLTQR
jgi:HAD superfamily hydrolase (TIGR01509 family)